MHRFANQTGVGKGADEKSWRNNEGMVRKEVKCIRELAVALLLYFGCDILEEPQAGTGVQVQA